MRLYWLPNLTQSSISITHSTKFHASSSQPHRQVYLTVTQFLSRSLTLDHIQPMNSFISPVRVQNIGIIGLSFEGPKSFSLNPGESHDVQPGDYDVKTADPDRLLVAKLFYPTGVDFKVEAKGGKPGVEFLSYAHLKPTLEWSNSFDSNTITL